MKYKKKKGSDVSKFCAQNFSSYLVKNENFIKGNIEESLVETFLKMDELLFAMTSVSGGCTANVVLIYKNQIYVANSGDSRSILYSEGRVFELSKDHKPDNDIEKARIMKAGGFVVNGRVNANLNLSRAIGDLEYKQNTNIKPGEQLISVIPDVTCRNIDPNDEFILIGCDGVYETLSNKALGEFIKKQIATNNGLKETVENLLDNILAPDTSS